MAKKYVNLIKENPTKTKYIPILTEATMEAVDSINSFFVALNTKPEAISNLAKVVASKLLGVEGLELQEHKVTKPLEGNELSLAKDGGYDHPYAIQLRFKYKEDKPFGNFINSIEINLVSPEVVQGKKTGTAIYFPGTPIKLNINTGDSVELGVNYAVYYMTTVKTFDVVMA